MSHEFCSILQSKLFVIDGVLGAPGKLTACCGFSWFEFAEYGVFVWNV